MLFRTLECNLEDALHFIFCLEARLYFFTKKKKKSILIITRTLTFQVTNLIPNIPPRLVSSKKQPSSQQSVCHPQKVMLSSHQD